METLMSILDVLLLSAAGVCALIFVFSWLSDFGPAPIGDDEFWKIED